VLGVRMAGQEVVPLDCIIDVLMAGVNAEFQSRGGDLVFVAGCIEYRLPGRYPSFQRIAAVGLANELRRILKLHACDAGRSERQIMEALGKITGKDFETALKEFESSFATAGHNQSVHWALVRQIKTAGVKVSEELQASTNQDVRQLDLRLSHLEGSRVEEPTAYELEVYFKQPTKKELLAMKDQLLEKIKPGKIKTQFQALLAPTKSEEDRAELLYRVQRFLDLQVEYTFGIEPHSLLWTLQSGKSHCFACAMLASFVLSVHGYQTTMLGWDPTEASGDCGHTVCMFRLPKIDHAGYLYGCLGKSSYFSLRDRSCVYKSPRELVMSFFDWHTGTHGVRTMEKWTMFNLYTMCNSDDWVTNLTSDCSHLETRWNNMGVHWRIVQPAGVAVAPLAKRKKKGVSSCGAARVRSCTEGAVIPRMQGNLQKWQKGPKVGKRVIKDGKRVPTLPARK